MLNGFAGAGAVCCQYGADATLNVDTKPVTIGGATVNVPRNTRGLLSQIGAALDKAIHGGDAQALAINMSAARGFSGGANVVPFPMVNPFKPVIAAREPVTALTRFPNRFTYEVTNGDGEPDDEQSSFDGLSGVGSGMAGLGLYDDTLGPPPPMVYRPTSGGTLQTILGTIQQTLPATIQAIRANPSNIFPGTQYGPYTTNYPGAVYPGSTPSGTGPAAGVGAGVGSAVDTLGGTVSRFVAEHPYMVIAGGAALVLLFMNPPRRR